jgi:hypothetical protein
MVHLVPQELQVPLAVLVLVVAAVADMAAMALLRPQCNKRS